MIMAASVFSLNTLFRVLYGLAMQWRAKLLYCGPPPSDSFLCWSPVSREMVSTQYTVHTGQIAVMLARTASG